MSLQVLNYSRRSYFKKEECAPCGEQILSFKSSPSYDVVSSTSYIYILLVKEMIFDHIDTNTLMIYDDLFLIVLLIV